MKTIRNTLLFGLLVYILQGNVLLHEFVNQFVNTLGLLVNTLGLPGWLTSIISIYVAYLVLFKGDGIIKRAANVAGTIIHSFETVEHHPAHKSIGRIVSKRPQLPKSIKSTQTLAAASRGFR